MKSSLLINFFERSIQTENFKKLIENEVKIFKESLKKKGSSTPVYFDNDLNQKIIITKLNLSFLLECEKKGILDKYCLSYIADILLLSEDINFESEDLKDEFDLITDFDLK